jgi:hypothetical protein
MGLRCALWLSGHSIGILQHQEHLQSRLAICNLAHAHGAAARAAEKMQLVPMVASAAAAEILSFLQAH